eukprot:jgi/Botrbrau1/19448/Bobra.0338s0069.1
MGQSVMILRIGKRQVMVHDHASFFKLTPCQGWASRRRDRYYNRIGSNIKQVSEKCKGRRRAFLPRAATASLPQIFPTTSPWGIWAALTLAGSLGIWSEETRIGKELSGPLVSTLVGLVLSNAGVIPCNAPAVYDVVNKYLLPLAVPLLLFSADLRRTLKETGQLLAVFLVGSMGTVIGTLVAFKVLPLASLGSDSWKVASALAARHIGGAVNYVAVAESLQIAPSAQMAGLAADNLLCALYFTTLFQLARKIPPDPPATSSGNGPDKNTIEASPIRFKVREGATALALSAMICHIGSQLAAWGGSPHSTITVVTGITVILATAMPHLLAPLVTSGEDMASLLLQIFFATVGANGSVRDVIGTAPALFVFCFLQIAVHLGFILSVGRIAKFPLREQLLASNANVGGPTTAVGMAAAKGWRTSLVPCLLVGSFGYAIATFVAMALGYTVLRRMAF